MILRFMMSWFENLIKIFFGEIPMWFHTFTTSTDRWPSILSSRIHLQNIKRRSIVPTCIPSIRISLQSCVISFFMWENLEVRLWHITINKRKSKNVSICSANLHGEEKSKIVEKATVDLEHSAEMFLKIVRFCQT